MFDEKSLRAKLFWTGVVSHTPFPALPIPSITSRLLICPFSLCYFNGVWAQRRRQAPEIAVVRGRGGGALDHCRVQGHSGIAYSFDSCNCSVAGLRPSHPLRRPRPVHLPPVSQITRVRNPLPSLRVLLPPFWVIMNLWLRSFQRNSVALHIYGDSD